ncbi:hypothetical protein H4F05_13800 [Vibrio cholerae]
MRVKIQRNEDGEYYFLIPNELQGDLSWEEGDTVEWTDNGDGTWTLRKLSQLEALKLRALEDPDVKAEYDRLSGDSNLEL